MNDEPILVLLDIDGTLLDAAGQGRAAFHDALAELFPGVRFPDLPMAGRTDRGLWIQLSALAEGAGSARFEDFVARYAAILEARLAVRPPVALPGAAELLAALESDPALQPGLVTGNVEEGAAAKMRAAGFWSDGNRPGAVPSAWGDADPDKGPLAVRALRSWGRPAPAVVVGDTPEDVRCARVAGIPCLAVLTGGFSDEVLRGHGAESVLPDLADVPATLSEIRRLARLPEGGRA